MQEDDIGGHALVYSSRMGWSTRSKEGTERDLMCVSI